MCVELAAFVHFPIFLFLYLLYHSDQQELFALLLFSEDSRWELVLEILGGRIGGLYLLSWLEAFAHWLEYLIVLVSTISSCQLCLVRLNHG